MLVVECLYTLMAVCCGYCWVVGTMEYTGMTIKDWFLEDPSLKPQIYASECITAMALNPPRPNFRQQACRKAQKHSPWTSLNDTQRSDKRVRKISEVSTASFSLYSFSILDSCPCIISSIIKKCGTHSQPTSVKRYRHVSALLFYICHWYRIVVHILRKDHALRTVRSSERVFVFKLLQPGMWNAGDSWEGFRE